MGKGGCRHIINAQCSIFMGGKENGKWFDCHECFEEMMGKPCVVVSRGVGDGGARPMPVDRRLDLEEITSPLSLVCKSCRKLFQKDLHIFGDDDLTCPHCENRRRSGAGARRRGGPPGRRRLRDPGDDARVRPHPRVHARGLGASAPPRRRDDVPRPPQAMMATTLDAPLRLEVDMAPQFEHLVDYSRLPPSLDPDYESKLAALLHRRIVSREPTPMLMATEDMSRPETGDARDAAAPRRAPRRAPSPTPPSSPGGSEC